MSNLAEDNNFLLKISSFRASGYETFPVELSNEVNDFVQSSSNKRKSLSPVVMLFPSMVNQTLCILSSLVLTMVKHFTITRRLFDRINVHNFDNF